MIEQTIKDILRENILTKRLYQKLKDNRESRRIKLKTIDDYKFIDRKKNLAKVCFIIAGYKPFLYDNVFGRIIKFIPKDIDVCIVSSGLYSDKLADIAEKNGWSYLSTKRNCVTLAQNIALINFDKAEYFYKIDEDIFVTKGMFETLYDTYKKVEAEGKYNVGFVAPLIPINGYGHYRLLERYNLIEYYSHNFERPKYASDPNAKIEKDAEVAKFFWCNRRMFPQIDDIADDLQTSEFTYSICPIRFSIGCIFMKRDTWLDMGMWEVLPQSACMGLDETGLCAYCIVSSKAIVVSENTVVGHLSFGQQNFEMEKYYKEHLDIFAC